MSTSTPPPKRQKSFKDDGGEPEYHLIYWPGMPGRGEHIRLCFEEAGVAYTDTAHVTDGVKEVLSFIQAAAPAADDTYNLPVCAPPILRHGDLVLNQTPNILLYLAPRLDLLPEGDENAAYRVNQLVLTALDGLSNEAHDCHHPIASGLYYEDQKEESLRKAKDYVTTRLPKFYGFFERALKSKASGEGPWLIGGKVTTADLVLFQVRSCLFSLLCLHTLHASLPSLRNVLTDERNY
jgi:glutathione S-transferase